MGDHAAVAGGVGGTHGHQRQARTSRTALVKQTAQGGGGDQRVVGEQDGHLAIAEMFGRAQGGMGRAEPVRLHGCGVGRGQAFELLHAWADDHGDV